MRRKGDGTKRPDGTWRIVLTLTDEWGAKTTKYISGKTQRECQAKAREFLRANEERRPRPNMTLAAFLESALEHRFEARCDPGTVRDYEALLGNWIAPAIGNVPLDGLTVAHVEHVMRLAAAEGKPRTANLIRAFLRAALKWGMKLDVIARNVADLADPVTYAPKRRALMTRRHLALVLEAEPSPVRRALWTFLAETGLRPGEAAALTWRELACVEGTWWVALERSKTAAGRQPVPVDADMVEAMERIRAPGCDLVFPNSRLRPFDAGNLSRAWYAAIERANANIADPARRVPDTNLYQLRKLFAREVATFAPDHVLKALMRHTDPRTTKQYYVSAEQSAMREAAEERKRRASGVWSGVEDLLARDFEPDEA